MAKTQQEFYIGAAQALKDGLIGGTYTIHGVHLSFLEALGQVGLSGSLHGNITKQVYRFVIGLSHATGWGVEQVLRNISVPGGHLPLARRQLLLVSSINGAFGDYLEQEKRMWALPMQFCKEGYSISLDEAVWGRLPARGAAVGESGIESLKSHVVVFVHGLCLHDQVWSLDDQMSFGARWEQQGKITSFNLRYNSGLHIHENGRRLADQMEALVKAYPKKIERLTLIGHSMGGLISRSACSYAEEQNLSWLNSLRDVACLGSPHQGAALERVGQLVTSTLEKSTFTNALSAAGKRRSAGIKDLRYGCLRHEDWEGGHPDEHVPVRITPVHILPDVRYCLVASNWKKSTAETIGDGLVQVSSGMANAGVLGDEGKHNVERTLLQGLNHMELPRHQSVYEILDEWLFKK